ncbi:hypothetical protein [Rhodospirillum rubrum]|uniref:Uncharacterized protein n=1 Tax=Rhodospirillum rubrum (strain ATCC 11170 / ATH 1.1.1 / DSM 467 / LMG 4362 / NCIMB 8255 / S1) TaxID=269796 RepID=Q2RYE8_RHORT|nr:hypothetical protein [Rhodospirillum rubrum]ABC20847.1 hypothetical protein Rru_A0042 [Rhodospirillum rubrum ATCC 11170]AEO46514.1 hypothetical protein F11_00215 [Rhodospirillum rubrum F11]MBK5952403.1 hypothetical protein [Rhodospirillum rubrum]QXG80550.1 hypothetical protein KUL73_00215 [Rhodospirillum rubrum]HAP99902.1 hypothetical protein [Rhodospirillum rubrum]
MAEDTHIPPQGDLFTAKSDPGDSAVSAGGAALSAEAQDIDFASYLASHGEGADNADGAFVSGDGTDGLMVGGLPPIRDAADDLAAGDDLLSEGPAPDLFLLIGDRPGDRAHRDLDGAWIGQDESDLERAGGDAASDPGAAFDLTDNTGVLVIDDARPPRADRRTG